MTLKTFILFFVAIASCVYLINALPRDASIIKQETISEANHVTPKEDNSSPTVTVRKDYKIPGRVICQFEEPTEDEVCQEHCLPKGYSFGICVSNTCSCV
ncbi:uncharacterized protein [Battus philenor]|uniref:uncharacterized protein n=1 Tax=Battus philenor TaxID=42288 RepID=UPI0035CEBC51